MAGTTIEFYDFYVYATAAVSVFPQLFFPRSNVIPVAQISDGRSLRRVAGCNVALGIDIGANKDPLALVESSTECASLVTDRSEFLIGLHGSKAFRRSSLACRAVNTVSAPPASGRIPSDADPSRSVKSLMQPIRWSTRERSRHDTSQATG